ncbi:hypothetical protein LVY74_00600 [Acinetobacter sp. ME22]|uniref:hypothetical protein n=1 Tax=Acinetobacter sp. ME22 TaxID=2904802 RepID=UPI001EDB8D27|nr:hypothetical protein [Acinetobacter sp. ME22]MCG2572059.1 hypothetical protein [Acinetobacter sp. ME22]
MTGFGSLYRARSAGLLVAGFDAASATSFNDATQQLSKSESREVQSLVEHARSLGLNIVSALILAVTNGELENELPSDYLDGLLVEATDEEDGDSDDLFNLIVGAVQDAFESLSIDETTISQMFADDVESADAAIEAACETALANLPDDGEPLDEFVREFIYGEPEEGEFDAALSSHQMKQKGSARVGSFSHKQVKGRKIIYKGAWAIRKGRKVVVNKRLPNQAVRLTAKQKQSMKKARLKAFTANAIRTRVKSLRKGRKLGLY